MHCITVTYPHTDGADFDFSYYMSSHVPMLSGLLGENLIRTEVRRGVQSLDGKPPAFLCVAGIWVKSVAEFQAMLSVHGQQIIGDVPNYTTIQPVLQIDELVI